MKTINAQQLDQMRSDRDILLINVLPEESFREQHIPGSQNIPVGHDDFVEQVESLAGDRDRTIVVYCANMQCSASPAAARKLEEAGFTNVYDFEGGMDEWVQSKHPIETGKAT